MTEDNKITNVSRETLQANMAIWDEAFPTPPGMVKKIKSGSYSAAGLSDIRTIHRWKRMTEIFGPIGKNWYVGYDFDAFEHNGEVVLYCTAKVSVTGWKHPIYGFGGNRLVTRTRNGMRINDDAYKMAATDAAGNAFMRLGIGGDVYSGKIGETTESWSKYSEGYDSPADGYTEPYTAPPILTPDDPDPATTAKPAPAKTYSEQGLAKIRNKVDELYETMAECVSSEALTEWYVDNKTSIDWLVDNFKEDGQALQDAMKTAYERFEHMEGMR